MTKPPSKGFLLPTDTNPPDNICFIVSVPNSPEYIRAFWGAYERPSHWWAWERDSQKRGRLAAARWRSAVQETRDTWQEIGDICDMNINVTVTQQCCDNSFPPFILNNNIHIGQPYVDEILALPGGYSDNGYEPPNDSYADYNGYLLDKCAYANKVADDLLLTFENLGNFGITLAGVSYAVLQTIVNTTSISAILAGTVAVSASTYAAAAGIALLLIGLGVYGSQVYSYFEAVADEMTKPELVCALYGASNAAEAKSRIEEAFDNFIVASLVEGNPGGPQFIQIWTQLAQYVMPIELFEPLFDVTDYVGTLPDANCTACLGVGGPVGLVTSIKHYYELEEASGTRYDSVLTSPYDLTILTGTPDNQVGVSGLGYYSPVGVNEAVRGPAGYLPLMGNNDYSVAVWARCDHAIAQGGASETICSWTDAGSNSDSEPAIIRFDYADGVSNKITCIMNGVVIISDAYFAPLDWVFIVFSHDAVNDLVYLTCNNGPTETLATGGVYANGATARFLVVGADYASGTTRYLHGMVDELSVHDKVLTANDRGWMYNNGYGRSFAEYV